MIEARTVFSQERLMDIFPPERTEEFFDALFGGAEEGAYDIRLGFVEGDNTSLTFAFELHQRPGKCLACNLTTGLPPVFSRHPVINSRGVAAALAELAGWPGQEEGGFTWKIGDTEQVSAKLHLVPLILTRSS